jgi:hypothetical protein
MYTYMQCMMLGKIFREIVVRQLLFVTILVKMVVFTSSHILSHQDTLFI